MFCLLYKFCVLCPSAGNYVVTIYRQLWINVKAELCDLYLDVFCGTLCLTYCYVLRFECRKSHAGLLMIWSVKRKIMYSRYPSWARFLTNLILIRILIGVERHYLFYHFYRRSYFNTIFVVNWRQVDIFVMNFIKLGVALAVKWASLLTKSILSGLNRRTKNCRPSNMLRYLFSSIILSSELCSGSAKRWKSLVICTS